jgi:hypothetical protein
MFADAVHEKLLRERVDDRAVLRQVHRLACPHRAINVVLVDLRVRARNGDNAVPGLHFRLRRPDADINIPKGRF